jgi:quercetin dioxygenase-like cupin family protein
VKDARRSKVFKSLITLFVDGQNYILETGDVLAFPGDCKHAYHNPDKTESQGISIVVLQTG